VEKGVASMVVDQTPVPGNVIPYDAAKKEIHVTVTMGARA
jgi:cellobiose phosphorylase